MSCHWFSTVIFAADSGWTDQRWVEEEEEVVVEEVTVVIVDRRRRVISNRIVWKEKEEGKVKGK
jgi:hypothetical protein